MNLNRELSEPKLIDAEYAAFYDAATASELREERDWAGFGEMQMVQFKNDIDQ